MSELYTLMKEYVQKGSTVLDIGANVGNVACAFAALGADVYAFEPQPNIYATLKRDVPGNVQVENLAVGAANDEISFYLDMRDGMQGVASSMMVLDDLKQANKIKEIRVRCVRLDDYVLAHGLRPDFIKIDVEGCEPDVFEGGIETIRSFRPVMFFEFWECHLPRYERWFEILSELYTLIRIPGRQEVREFYRLNQNPNGNIDILCVPKIS
ncbi:MAG: FkbM family methyltransferase [Proteobacteria bacterium]|nr:FkbM family methyltransferase [Pseudomonadota bacterium]HQR04679.1 FkbM family methyltransferase [Rhodocyclaceae bacterium]